MACVRRGPTACLHRPGCPHDIGPAAAKTSSGVNAAAHAAGLLERAEGSLADRAQLAGSGPVERRAETAAERVLRHAREHPSWEEPAAAAGVPMHLPRPRSLRPVTPSQQPQEDPVPTAEPVPVPCGTCLHEPVCGLRASIPADPETSPTVHALAPGLRMVFTDARIECDFHLASVIAPRPAIADAVHAEPRPSPAAIAQASRMRGAAHLRRASDVQIVDAVRASGGDMEAAGRLLPITSSGARLRVKSMAAAGTLPPDVAAMLAARTRSGKPRAATA